MGISSTTEPLSVAISLQVVIRVTARGYFVFVFRVCHREPLSKMNARVGSCLAVAICTGANGQIPTRIVRHAADAEADGTINYPEGASQSLMQSMSVNLAANGSASNYHMQSVKLLGELAKLDAGVTKLPKSIKLFIAGIKEQSVQSKQNFLTSTYP